MDVLAVFDEKNYDDTTKVYEKYNVRGVIFRDGKIAMQCSTDGEYKMPGGGMEKGESFLETDPPADSPRPGDAKYCPAFCPTTDRGCASGAARRILFATCRAAYRGAQTESDAEIVRRQL